MNPTVILCPIELSSSNRVALASALSLARWHDAELHVLHVRPGRRERLRAFGASEEVVFERLMGVLGTVDSDGARVSPTVLTGDPVVAVADHAKRQRADLVLVGQHGRAGSRYWPSGAFAAAIGRGVECPTIAVPDSAAPKTAAASHGIFKNILCAIDFSHASIQAFNEALALAQQSAGRLMLLHVLERYPYEAARSGERALHLFDDYRALVDRTNNDLHLLVPPDALNWCLVDAETAMGVPHDAISAAAKTYDCDLIVMGLPRRSPGPIVLRSTVERVLRRSPCPVLMVPGADPAGHAEIAVAPAGAVIVPMTTAPAELSCR